MSTGIFRDFEGKVVLITGAASGMGAATAFEFARRGAILSLIDLNDLKDTTEKCKSEVSSLGSKEFKVLAHSGDLTQTSVCEKYVQDTIDTFGSIDVLINCAGISKSDSALNADVDVFDKIFAINTKAIYQLTSLCVPHLIKTKGNIVNISSACTSVVLNGRHLSYSMSKAAVDIFTRSTAAELGPHGVHVNSINPGVVKTGLVSETAVQKYGKEHAIRRCGTTEEIATAIAFIASPKNSFMTGSNVLCDGGLTVSRFHT